MSPRWLIEIFRLMEVVICKNKKRKRVIYYYIKLEKVMSKIPSIIFPNPNLPKANSSCTPPKEKISQLHEWIGSDSGLITQVGLD